MDVLLLILRFDDVISKIQGLNHSIFTYCKLNYNEITVFKKLTVTCTEMN